MKFNYRKLLGKITEKVGTQAEFAHAIGLSEQSVSLKLNGRVDFRQNEIFNACKILSIDRADVGDYFFTDEV